MASRHQHLHAEVVTLSIKRRCSAPRDGREIAIPINLDSLLLEAQLVLFHAFVHPEFGCAVTRKDHRPLNEDIAPVGDGCYWVEG